MRTVSDVVAQRGAALVGGVARLGRLRVSEAGPGVGVRVFAQVLGGGARRDAAALFEEGFSRTSLTCF